MDYITVTEAVNECEKVIGAADGHPSSDGFPEGRVRVN
jgi:hypothetical protein